MRARLVSAALAAFFFVGPLAARAQDELELESLGTGIKGSAFFSPYDNLDRKVLAALEQARPGTTVYMSYYSLSYAEYPKMFKKLKDRGVTVRLNLFEGVALDPTYLIDDELKTAGFDVALIPNLRSRGGTASLHTKFTVVNDELVVTGSANLSASASLANHEHIVVVKNAGLARTYVAEWNEQRAAEAVMRAALTPAEWTTFNSAKTFPSNWAGARERALRDRLLAVDKKTANTLSLVKTYFSPDDVCEEQARAEIAKARKSVRIAMYSFVSVPLARACVDAARRGCEVQVVCDEHQQSIDASQAVNDLLESEPTIRFVRGNNHLGNYSSIHQKYAVIDDTVVLAGSFNWTVQANRYNDENLIVVRSKKFAAKFLRDFASLLATYDPEGTPLSVTTPGNQTRVLFAIAVPNAPRGYDVVVYGDCPELGDGDPAKGVALRTSRSTEPNWLGGILLPRGKEVHWRLALRKQGSLAGNITNPGQAGETKPDTAGARTLAVNAQGVAHIVHGEWAGPMPAAVVTPNATPTNTPGATPTNAPAPTPNVPNQPNPVPPGGTPN